MSNNNKYQKAGGTRPVLPAEKTVKAEEIPRSFDKFQVPVGYTKPEGTSSPAQVMIFSGGVIREIRYFQLIENTQRHSFPRITIKTICRSSDQPDGGLSPKKLYREAKKIKKIQGDEVYLVCDIDHFINELLEITSLCINDGYQLIISNPCFEVWLYYGKCSAKPDRHMIPFVCPNNPLQISQAFKTYLNTVVQGGVNPNTAIYDIEQAIKNAQNNHSEDKQGIPRLYSTKMFELANRLLELIKPELDELRRRKQEEREKFKKQNIENTNRC